jgi:hypothetical protein
MHLSQEEWKAKLLSAAPQTKTKAASPRSRAQNWGGAIPQQLTPCLGMLV